MKKLLLALTCALSTAAFADIRLDNLTKKDVENITGEFGGNFAHTAVAAPETNGLWGIEVGVLAGRTGSPDLKKVVNDSNGKGSDFANLYHAGVMGRVHIPFDIFAEVTLLPEQEIEDVKIKNQTFSVGWNAGRFFNLPLDLALGLDSGKGEVSFTQDNPAPNTKIALETKTSVYWVGLSKTFAFFTPYLKVGTAQIDGELKGDATIFATPATSKETANVSGTYYAVGANLQFFFLRLGVEASQVVDARRISGKFSFAF
jgi:hypothetical protein